MDYNEKGKRCMAAKPRSTNIDEEVNKYIRCHELQTASACDGVCNDCEFDIPEEVHKALYTLHQNILTNEWME